MSERPKALIYILRGAVVMNNPKLHAIGGHHCGLADLLNFISSSLRGNGILWANRRHTQISISLPEREIATIGLRLLGSAFLDGRGLRTIPLLLPVRSQVVPTRRRRFHFDRR